MALSPIFQEFGKEVLLHNSGEIGMHLHAWNSPPLFELSKNDYLEQPYLIEYPENIMNEKIMVLNDILENTFNNKMISHRSGRWALNDIYVKLLKL